jgi:hypothetical protein
MTQIEMTVLEGLLCFDGRVLELFRNDGRTGAWRLHVGVITAVEQDRRRDRIEARFFTNQHFYESAQVPLADEPALLGLIAAVELATG